MWTTNRGTLTVRRALVKGAGWKVPKERSRVRDVELLTPAIEYLKKLAEFSYSQPAVEVTVLQRNNITRTMETITPIIQNSTSNENQVVSPQTWDRLLRGFMKSAKIRVRGPNQCRHTYASQLLTRYVELEYIARMMGHSSTLMVRKHYGRWIKNDTPNQAGRISLMLGFAEPKPVKDWQKKGKNVPNQCPKTD